MGSFFVFIPERVRAKFLNQKIDKHAYIRGEMTGAGINSI
jgi:hypothetical protein